MKCAGTVIQTYILVYIGHIINSGAAYTDLFPVNKFSLWSPQSDFIFQIIASITIKTA